MTTIEQLQRDLGVTFFPHQLEAFEDWLAQPEGQQRLCLYHRTGAGKSITALSCIALAGCREVLVIAPPATHSQWVDLGRQMNVEVHAISHAKFRMPSFKIDRNMPVICDEFHLLGGAQGKGWKRFSVLAQGIKASFVICSATPNYNDAERCYCIKYVLDPANTRGGLIQFIYTYCTTEENYFGRIPLVKGFHSVENAAEFLSQLTHVKYLPDEVEYVVTDLPIYHYVPEEFLRYGLDLRRERIVASTMERQWQMTYLALLDDRGDLRKNVYDLLTQIAGEATTPILVFCASSRIAKAVAREADRHHVRSALVTGETTAANKDLAVQMFKEDKLDLLIGTATLATGVDGIDKVCDTMVIVHDTDDDSLRRQLIGRILPRGEDSDASNKKIYRLVPSVP